MLNKDPSPVVSSQLLAPSRTHTVVGLLLRFCPQLPLLAEQPGAQVSSGEKQDFYQEAGGWAGVVHAAAGAAGAWSRDGSRSWSWMVYAVEGRERVVDVCRRSRRRRSYLCCSGTVVDLKEYREAETRVVKSRACSLLKRWHLCRSTCGSAPCGEQYRREIRPEGICWP